MWPSAPGRAIAGVKGQPDGKQRDLNLSEFTPEEVFAGGFHSTCCPMTSSAGTETHFILFMETFLFLPSKQYHFSSAFPSFSSEQGFQQEKLGVCCPKVSTVTVSYWVRVILPNAHTWLRKKSKLLPNQKFLSWSA